MEKMLMKYSDELKNIFLDYQLFLNANAIDSKKSIHYIFDIINYFEISKKYIEKIEFDNQLKCNGIFFPERKKIVLNTMPFEAATHLKFITFNQLILEYFCLLLHEINHVLQIRYRDLIDDDVTFLLNTSEFLKVYSLNKKNKFYDLFPDEIDSNIRASKLLYDINQCKLTKENLIYYLTLGTIYKNNIINSPIDYLYNEILNLNFEENLQNINSIYYGLKKDDDLLQSILDSYQTHEICVDIEKERRIRKCN